MIGFTHAVFGAVSGAKAKNIFEAGRKGIASHFLLDRIPHQDYELANKTALAADLTATAAGLYLARKVNSKAFVGGVCGILPDVALVLENKLDLDITKSYHVANHTDTRVGLWASMATQLAVGAYSTAVLVVKAQKDDDTTG